MNAKQTPEPYRSIIDKACEKDRAWFERHPGRNERVRPAIQGEMWPWQTPTGAMILVKQIRPGVRERQLLSHISPLKRYPGTEDRYDTE